MVVVGRNGYKYIPGNIINAQRRRQIENKTRGWGREREREGGRDDERTG